LFFFLDGGGGEDEDDGDEARLEAIAPQFGQAMGSFTAGFSGPSAAAMAMPQNVRIRHFLISVFPLTQLTLES